MPHEEEVVVTLAKRTTADGVEMVRDEVPLGKVYHMITGSICDVKWMDNTTSKVTCRKTAYFYDDAGVGGLMPMELFNIPEE